MVLDTSAIIAILEDEPSAAALTGALSGADVIRVSAGSLLEAGIVAEVRAGEAGDRELDVLLHRLRAEISPVTPEQVDVARDAYRRYGKGRHPAALNFGDCFAYALAVSVGEPLLFTGSDFPQTDVVVAAY